MNNSFGQHERLKHKRYFDALFSLGESVKSYPVMAVFLELNQSNFPNYEKLPANSQVGFAVPKKRFKKAVDRNRIKRQMRESYRLNKQLLVGNYAVVFVYLPNEKIDFCQIEKSIKILLEQIKTKK